MCSLLRKDNPDLQRQWFDVPAVTTLTGWSRDHANRHLTRLFEAGSPHVINSAIAGQKRRHLHISRPGLDALLSSLTGKAQREAEL